MGIKWLKEAIFEAATFFPKQRQKTVNNTSHQAVVKEIFGNDIKIEEMT
jgi:hypothetical protein